jgi:GNAT superfamily N-acetyltransferase
MNTIHEWRRGEHVISTNRTWIDLGVVHGFLSTSYWAKNIPRETVARSIENSLCYGIYRGKRQVGFARVISDFATYAYIGDVFVIEVERGQGLSKWLMEVIVSTPELQGLRRWVLATRDAHGLYAQHGFKALASPDRWMERWNPEVYTPGKKSEC